MMLSYLFATCYYNVHFGSSYTTRERLEREEEREREREKERESERERRESGWVCVRKKGNFSLSCSNKNETPRFYGEERK